ncbi:MAG: putative zinc-binding metallopeptidase [Patescibacteria group bacterium]
MKRFLLFVLVAVMALLVDCHAIPVAPSAFKSVHGFKLYGSFTWQEASDLDKLVSVLPQAVIKSIEFIAKIDDLGHFNGDAGHCAEIGRICIKNEYINNCNIVWHEIAHAYTHSIIYTSVFEEEWKEVAGDDVYSGQKSSNYKYPQDGLATDYGRTNWMEDSAEFVTEFYKAVNNKPSQFNNLEKTEWNRDKRYKAKLDLLYKYGFISLRDYEKFEKIFLAPN